MDLEITITYGQNKQKTYSTSCTLTGLERKMQLLAEDIRDEILRPHIAEDISRRLAELQFNCIEPKYIILSPEAEEELEKGFCCVNPPDTHLSRYHDLPVILSDKVHGWSIGV